MLASIMEAELSRGFDAVVSAGAGEVLAGHRFVALVPLESGARLGLGRPEAEGHPDVAPSWLLVTGETVQSFSPGQERGFVELLEWSRSEFDETLERAAAEVGLPAEDVLFSFPAVDLVRAMLTAGSVHYCRVALSWLRASELREVRSEIVALSADTSLPTAVRELAVRLTVPL